MNFSCLKQITISNEQLLAKLPTIDLGEVVGANVTAIKQLVAMHNLQRNFSIELRKIDHLQSRLNTLLVTNESVYQGGVSGKPFLALVAETDIEKSLGITMKDKLGHSVEGLNDLFKFVTFDNIKVVLRELFNIILYIIEHITRFIKEFFSDSAAQTLHKQIERYIDSIHDLGTYMNYRNQRVSEDIKQALAGLSLENVPSYTEVFTRFNQLNLVLDGIEEAVAHADETVLNDDKNNFFMVKVKTLLAQYQSKPWIKFEGVGELQSGPVDTTKRMSFEPIATQSYVFLDSGWDSVEAVTKLRDAASAGYSHAQEILANFRKWQTTVRTELNELDNVNSAHGKRLNNKMNKILSVCIMYQDLIGCTEEHIVMLNSIMRQCTEAYNSTVATIKNKYKFTSQTPTQTAP